MRLAFALRSRRALTLMPIKPASSPLLQSSSSSSHPYSQQSRSSSSPKRTSDSPLGEEPPAKHPKVIHTYRAPSGSSPMSQQDRSHPRSGRGAGSSLLARAHKNNVSGGGRGGKRKQKEFRGPLLAGPVHDEQYITTTYRTKPLKKIYETNPKSPLNNYIMATTGGTIEPTAVHGMVEGGDQQLWR